MCSRDLRCVYFSFCPVLPTSHSLQTGKTAATASMGSEATEPLVATGPKKNYSDVIAFRTFAAGSELAEKCLFKG